MKLDAVAAKTRVMPADFLDGDHDVTQKFIDYVRPLVGELPAIERL